MSRYLVTGCAGFIGSHLTDTLLAPGHGSSQTSLEEGLAEQPEYAAASNRQQLVVLGG